MDKTPIRPPAAASLAHRSPREDSHEEKSPPVTEDGLIVFLHRVIHWAVRVLAILMTLVILWGVADVAYVLYQKLLEPPFLLLTVTDTLAIFGSFLSVLIGIEIFASITLYIKHDALPIKMVIATALMAIARKVIALDFKDLDWPYVIAIACVTLALGLTYWLISYKPKSVPHDERP